MTFKTAFSRFLLHAGSRYKGLYLSSTVVWTMIHGLPLLVGVGVQALLDEAAGAPTASSTWWLLGLVVATMAARALVLVGGLGLDFTLIFRVSAHLKTSVLARLVGRSRARGPRLKEGDQLNRIREDTDEIAEFLGWTADLFYRTVLLFIALGVLLSTDVVVTLSLLPLVGAVWLSTTLKRRIGTLQEETRERQGRIAGAFTDLLSGIRDVRLANTVHHRVEDLSGQFTERRKVQARQQVASDFLSGLFQNMVTFGTAIVLMVTATRMAAGEFTVGELALFLTYTSWLSEQVFFFGRAMARAEQGRVSYDRLRELADGEPAPVPEDAPRLTELRVEQLACDGRFGPVSFTATPGTLVAVTGEVGTGKSAFLHALLALTPDAEGRVLWNGRDVTGDAGWWQAPRASYARQSAHFIQGTARDNLLLGGAAVDRDSLEETLRAVCLEPGSTELPDGLDTRIGSGDASGLSGGQRQRLALARMLCRPADVYVVDDCDSSLDGETARRMWADLPRLRPAVWIVVSHNPDLLAAADQVVRLDRARVGA
ncbi:ATP-binding cassette domain-containing protein [Streptomyces sp. NPDC014735]|uniref:ATP-binding cassette domain-containing protein n=1 Tax=unclassified Streptomyces TaxID=2593676 RepID=UPI003701A72B